jgi:hypothetical protein
MAVPRRAASVRVMVVSLLVPSEYLTETLSWVDAFQAGNRGPVNNPDKKDREMRRLAAIPGAVQGPATEERDNSCAPGSPS